VESLGEIAPEPVAAVDLVVGAGHEGGVGISENESLVGDATKNQAAMNPTNAVFDAKRMISRKFPDPIVQKDMHHWPSKVVRADADRSQVQVEWKEETKRFCPEEISAMVRGKMKDIAETQLTKKVTDAVVTVTDYFNDA
jgi:L1 cell adhesion molecule like protein